LYREEGFLIQAFIILAFRQGHGIFFANFDNKKKMVLLQSNVYNVA